MIKWESTIYCRRPFYRQQAEDGKKKNKNQISSLQKKIFFWFIFFEKKKKKIHYLDPEITVVLERRRRPPPPNGTRSALSSQIVRCDLNIEAVRAWLEIIRIPTKERGQAPAQWGLQLGFKHDLVAANRQQQGFDGPAWANVYARNTMFWYFQTPEK